MGGKVYAIDSYRAGGTRPLIGIRDVGKYTSDAWIRQTDLPGAARHESAAFALDDKLYAAGGCDLTTSDNV